MRPAFSPRCTVRGLPHSSERCRSTHGPERSVVCRWSCRQQKVWCCCRGSPWAVVPIGSSRGPGRRHQPPAHWRKLLRDGDKNDQLCATELQLNNTVKLGDSLFRVWTIQGGYSARVQAPNKWSLLIYSPDCKTYIRFILPFSKFHKTPNNQVW